MKISKLIFKNFMGYKSLALPHGEDASFPQGLILISGKNSYGKSTILQGILLAFFGPTIFKGRNASSFITYGENKAELRVYFELDDLSYYVFRKWGRTGSATSKLFKMDKAGVYREEKKFNVEQFFEISKDQALSTVFVRQGEVENLANKKGADLREMVIDLFRLNIIDDALLYLDKKSKTEKNFKEKLEKTRVPIERIQQDIDRIETESADTKKEIEKLKKKEKLLQKDMEKLPKDEIISNLESLLTKKEIAQNKYETYKNDFEKKLSKVNLNPEDLRSPKLLEKKLLELTQKKNEIEKELNELKQNKEATVKGLGVTRGRLDIVNVKIKKMQGSLEFTKTANNKETAKCPTCQSDLTKEHYDKMMQEFSKDKELFQGKIKTIENIIKEYETGIEKFQKIFDTLKAEILINQTLKDDFENYQKYKIENENVLEEYKEFESQYQDDLKDFSKEGLKKIRLKKERSKIELEQIVREKTEKEGLLEDNKVRLKKLNDERKKMEEIETEIGELEVNIEHLNKAKEYVRRFVTEYMVVKRLVKNIALTTDKYIKNFTSGQYSDLVLDLSGSKKTGLSLKITDNYNGVSEPIEVLSGGDRTALGMALRLAISELMGRIRPTKDSPRRNPKINFLLLDEPLAALDEVRREKILLYLTQAKAFSQIFLITHTAIPPNFLTHKVVVEKDHSTGISSAEFKEMKSLISL